MSLPNEYQRIAENQIHDAAATVLAQIEIREAHPSYGYTKTGIRAAASHMEGAIGLYMVLTGQANHLNASSLAEFVMPETKAKVDEVRATMKEF